MRLLFLVQSWDDRMIYRHSNGALKRGGFHEEQKEGQIGTPALK